jgi:predicted membrane channel-forming protein YqfA (hemolysin III family)
VLLVWTSILWQITFVGIVGVIFCVHTLLAGILISAFIPIVGVLAVIFFHEKFSSDKAIALVLSLWGLASYSYGDYIAAKQKKKVAALRAITSEEGSTI